MYQQTAISRNTLRLGSFLRAGGFLCLVYVGYWMFMQYQTEQQYAQIPSTASLPKDTKPKSLPRGHFIGKVQIAGKSAVVLEGVDDHTLKLAVGHVPGTALPGQRGRIALAAHRDTFFRPLRNINVGSRITLTTSEGRFEYQVTKTEIVKPTATEVLKPTKTNTLTLITCYPFNYIGSAPLRFIVHAKKIEKLV